MLIDLRQPGIVLPPRSVVDSSVIIDWLGTIPGLAPSSAALSTAQVRAAGFVRLLAVHRAIGLVVSRSLDEVFHFVIKAKYRAELANYQPDLRARYPNVRRHGWEHLFKARPDLVRQFAPGLDRIRRMMSGNRLLVVQPEDLGPIPAGRSLDDVLVRTMERYALDSSDAAILIEAARAGVRAIAASDPDLYRAQLDFDVYIWR